MTTDLIMQVNVRTTAHTFLSFRSPRVTFHHTKYTSLVLVLAFLAVQLVANQSSSVVVACTFTLRLRAGKPRAAGNKPMP